MRTVTVALTISGAALVFALAWFRDLGVQNVLVATGALVGLWALWSLSAFFAYADEREKRISLESTRAELVVNYNTSMFTLDGDIFEQPVEVTVRNDGPSQAKSILFEVESVQPTPRFEHIVHFPAKLPYHGGNDDDSLNAGGVLVSSFIRIQKSGTALPDNRVYAIADWGQLFTFHMEDGTPYCITIRLTAENSDAQVIDIPITRHGYCVEVGSNA